MKTLLSLFTFFLLLGAAQASDVSCQINILKPKMNATLIEEEQDKPAQITVAEARMRLQASNDDAEERDSSQSDDEELTTETAEKDSGLGSMFDILLPAKLRNPVQK